MRRGRVTRTGTRSQSLANELGAFAHELSADSLSEDATPSRTRADTEALARTRADNEALSQTRAENETLSQTVSTLQNELAEKFAELSVANEQLEKLEGELQKMMEFNELLTHDFDDVQSMLERKQIELERAQDDTDERMKEAVRSAVDRYEALLAGLKLGTKAHSSASPTHTVSERSVK